MRCLRVFVRPTHRATHLARSRYSEPGNEVGLIRLNGCHKHNSAMWSRSPLNVCVFLLVGFRAVSKSLFPLNRTRMDLIVTTVDYFSLMLFRRYLDYRIKAGRWFSAATFLILSIVQSYNRSSNHARAEGP